MDPVWIAFIFGVFLGVPLGFLILSLLTMAGPAGPHRRRIGTGMPPEIPPGTLE